MPLKNYLTKNCIEVGCDEAGRGCLAGPVYAAAVILDPKKKNQALDDSKKLTTKKRNELRLWIEENALAWAVASLSPQEIDEHNILKASFMAMHRAIDKLDVDFDHLLIDGNRFIPYQDKTHHCIIKGDGKFKSIAAASILAKTHRDEHMNELSQEFPDYQWHKNFGYPTKIHREAIRTNGSSKYHRQSFRLLPEQLKIKF
ncbi:MAG: ribonuclease HII [Vicingaceae bacterium]